MVDFFNEIRDSNEPASTFPTPVNPSFSSAFNVLDASQIPAQQPQTFMSLGQLSSEYATYLLLNVSPIICLSECFERVDDFYTVQCLQTRGYSLMD
jgi:hypothetical protein